jgi:hypothetical protein
MAILVLLTAFWVLGPAPAPALAGGSPPPAPVGLYLTANADSSLSLSWDATPGATGYNIYRGNATGGEASTPIASTTKTSYTDKGLSGTPVYFYEITALNAGGESPRSLETASKTPPPVGTGGNTPGVASGSSLVFYAKDALFSGFGWSQAQSGWFPQLIGSSGSNSPGQQVVDMAYASDDAISFNDVVEPASGLYTVDWRYAFAAGLFPGVTDRQMGLAVNGSTITTTLRFPITGSFDVYQHSAVQVQLNKGVNSISLLAESGHAVSRVDELTVTPATAAGPGAPSVTALATSSGVTLNWTAGSGTPTSYTIYRGTSSDGEATAPIATVTGSTTTYPDNSGTAVTTYFYLVTASNAAGSSPDSNEIYATPGVTVPGGANLAYGQPAYASSIEASGYPASSAVDGSFNSRWSSAFSDPQWLMVDLGATYTVDQVVLGWESAYATAFQVQISSDGTTWTTIYTTTSGSGSTQSLTVTGTGRYIRMYGTQRATGYGYSLWEFGVYGAAVAVPFAIQALDGTGNNVTNPTWGEAGLPYARNASPQYADGVGAMQGGPNARYISNRVMNDIHQNVFSERAMTQWVWTWGQFLDHTFGNADGSGSTATTANIAFNPSDPLEDYTDTLGYIPFSRSSQAPGTGTSTSNPRQQTNTLSTYLNAFAMYGGTDSRLSWLRNGPDDGNPADSLATLFLPNNYLPRSDARGNVATAPTMALDGSLIGNQAAARVAGDVRANENMALTAITTLFDREHNRIVSLLPNTMSEETKFQIARRVVIAEQQYITYNEFLPALGVALPQYTGYNPSVNDTLSTEFATVGYRVHSMIHGNFDVTTDASRYTSADLAYFVAQGATVTQTGTSVDITVPTFASFFNPDLMQRIGIGPFLTSLNESQYKNDEQFTNQIRSVLFQVPVQGNPGCLPTAQPACFTGVNDLAALDIQRGRDHGIPTYNALRQAYGLAPKTSFTAITGESTDQFPAGVTVDSRSSLDTMSLSDIDGNPVAIGASDGATYDTRRSSVAARLKAIYGGNVNNVDAFVGMISEPHVPGTEFGELQLAMWTKEFQHLRDGDRFFYGNDQGLSYILNTYGIDYRRTLGQVVEANTDAPAAEISPDVFLVHTDDLPPTSCTVTYTVTSSSAGSYKTDLKITNTGTTAINGWTIGFQLANGQTIGSAGGNRVNATYTQTGTYGQDVIATNLSTDATIAPGTSLDGIGFTASWDNATNAKPPTYSVNGHRCAVG